MTRRRLRVAIGTALSFTAAATASQSAAASLQLEHPAANAAAVQTPATSSDTADEVVVIGRRSGVPMWRVDGPTGTVILVGSMERVVEGTSWDPTALTEAMRRSDRVMFPGMRSAEFGLFTFFSLRKQWKRHAKLPAGQSLSSLLEPGDFRRLQALQRAGVIRPNFSTRHPFHLANDLLDRSMRGVRFDRGVNNHVRRVVRQHRLNLVPITEINTRNFAAEFFGAPARVFVPCLLDAMEVAERGGGVFQERSAAWGARRVPEVIRSPVQRSERSCRLSANPFNDPVEREIGQTVRAQLAQPGVTIAVVDMTVIARDGGLLDSLRAAGFNIRGPAWR